MAKQTADATSQDSVSKTEAVRKAIADGWAKPTEGVMYVKTMFGIDLSPNHFSNIKSSLGGAPKKGKRRGRPPGSKNQAKAEPAPVVAAPAPASDRIDIEAIQTVKDLIARVGAADLKRLVGALGK